MPVKIDNLNFKQSVLVIIMNRYLSVLWTQVRNILIIGYKHTTVYEIPIVFNSEMTVFESVVVENGKIIVTMKQAPPKN